MTSEHIESHRAAALRNLASDRWRDRDWRGLLHLLEHLRQDPLWPVFWCALCAVAARQCGRCDARELLHEAIDGGFMEVPLLRADLAEAFGGDDDWDSTLAAIAANQPVQPFRLTGWPVQEPMWPLNLCDLPADRAEVLLSRLPPRGPRAWDTALAVLAWVTTRWAHANHRAYGQDAVGILDRVARGERFACPEYATVLSQSLNALRIPARCVYLTLAHHHEGTGRSHVATEAWIDELGKWVVLDGQNGLFWCDPYGTPLGLAELRHEDWPPGHRPDAVCLSRQHGKPRLDAWWEYFGGPANVAGRLWAPASLGLMCEGMPFTAAAVQLDGRGLHPLLDKPSVGLAPIAGQPALRLGSIHPYAVGFGVRAGTALHRLTMDDTAWPLEHVPQANHSVDVCVVTEYGELRSYAISYETA